MKLALALTGAVVALGLPALSSADTVNWNFLNDVGASSGVSVNSPHTFADTSSMGVGVTASVLGNSGDHLYEKNQGDHETGLGVTELDDHEIDKTVDVRLNLSDVINKLHPSQISILFGSVQSGESAEVIYGNGTTSVFSDESLHKLNLSTIEANGDYVDITAPHGDILVSDLSVTPAPEPAETALVGGGLLGLALVGRRKFAANKA